MRIDDIVYAESAYVAWWDWSGVEPVGWLGPALHTWSRGATGHSWGDTMEEKSHNLGIWKDMKRCTGESTDTPGQGGHWTLGVMRGHNGRKSVSFSMRRRVVEPPIAMERSHIYQSHHGGKSTLMRWGHSEKCSHINAFSIYQEIWGSMRMKSLRRMVLRGARHLYEGTQRDFMRHNRPHTKDLCPVEIHEGQRS